jgi:5-methylcytosine-specific restriction enzyme B
MGKLKEFVERFQNEYVSSKQGTFAGHPFGNYIRNDVPSIFYDTGLVDRDDYLVTGSVGQGNWALVPWVCVFDKSITTSATKGVYIVYLLAKDGNSLYLTFNQGCTDIRNTHTKRETIQIMRNIAQEIANRIDSRGFATDFTIDLGSELTELAEMYAKGTVFYKKYIKGNIPDEIELENDLAKMMDIYREYANKQVEQTVIDATGGEEEVSTKGTIDSIKRYIASRGFTYEDGLVENFFLSLKSKPFVILAGTSGTGKTRLVKLFAEAVGATSMNGHYQMVSVRPDWSDSSDLFGHVDLNGRFIPGAVIDFVKRAELDENHPYFLCLDEMNLARVEYYLSDVLSVIETRDFDVTGKITTDPLVTENYYGSDVKASGKYGTVRLPENLYIIGTVNMDETTFPFSRKVLDRANTIEFSYVDVMPDFVAVDSTGASLNLANSFMKADYIHLAQCSADAADVNAICLKLKEINEVLKKANAHVGYRVRDEIVFYMLNNKKAGLLDEDISLDNEIMQKILPRIQGSSSTVKEMLCELFKICAGDYDGYQTDSETIHKKMFDYISKKECKYKHSAEKIAYMVRRYETDGFTQYWL